jgi:hypothetical protein
MASTAPAQVEPSAGDFASDCDRAGRMLNMNMDASPPEKVGEIKKWLYVIRTDFPQILTILVIAIPIIWLSISFLYKSELDSKDAQIATKEEQIKLVERQRDDFKAKTGTSTPDEAKAKIDALTTQVEKLGSRVVALEPRRLMASERDQFRENVRLPANVHYNITVKFDLSCADCKAYADDFAAILQTPEVGWNVTEPSVLAPGGRIPRTGIAVYTDNSSNPSSAIVILKRALDAAKIKYDIIFQPAHAMPLGLPTPDVEMLVTTKSNPQ